MEKIVVEKLNEVYFRLKNLSQSQSMELRSFLSCKMDNYWFHPKYKMGVWDGTIYFFNPHDELLPIGLYPQLVKFSQQFSYKLEFTFDPSEMYNDIPEDMFEKFYKTIFLNPIYEPRDYQDDIIRVALNKKRGIIEAATGAGKTVIIYSLIRFLMGLDKKILLIVPNISLVTQLLSDMKDYGWEDCENFCSFVYGGSKRIDFNKPIIVSTWQSIYKKDESFFDKFGAVICDETHLAKGLSIKTCLSKCVNADYRYGLTGTIPTSVMDKFTIFGYIGPKIYGLTSSTLIDKGILSKIKIANLLLEYSGQEVYQYWHDLEGHVVGKDYNTELEMIYTCKWRNNVFKYILNNFDSSQNVLILCDRIEQLKNISEYLRNNVSYNVQEYYGEVKAEERESIRSLTSKQGNNIIVATYHTMSQGVNIPRLHHIFLAASSRSLVRVLQSIGRGLRIHETKDKLIVWDMVDDLSWEHEWNGKFVMHFNHVYKHWKQRLQYYKAQGFKFITKKINISGETDFIR